MKNSRFIVLFFILILIFAVGCSNEASEVENQTNDMNTNESDVSSDTVNIIKIRAFQYGYEPSVINVKLNEPTKFIITTDDVSHGFYVKEFDIDVVINEGEETIVEFTPTKTGEFKVICNVMCGSGHSDMEGTLKVSE